MSEPDASEPLRRIAQYNADLADALHAQSASLCIYLLDMREYFRWARRLPLDHPLPRSELGPWISAREEHWENLRAEAAERGRAVFRPVDPARSEDPFDVSAIRDNLRAAGLVYGAGIGRFGRAQFFLGRVIERSTRDGCEVLVCGEELARGATAPPGMSRGREILIRQDALDRWLWTRYEEWRLHPRDNGLAAAYAIHEAVGAGDPLAVLGRMARHEREALILHELGERAVDAELGDAWHDLIDEAPSRKAEVLARALRDLLADCTMTLPTLLERADAASIHCWFGLLDGMRQKLAAGMLADYRRWRAGDPQALAERLPEARAHWRNACALVLAAWQDEGPAGLDRLVEDESLTFS